MMESYGFLLSWQSYEDDPGSTTTNLDASGTLKPPTHQGSLKQLSVLMVALSLLEGTVGKPAQAYSPTAATHATEALTTEALAMTDSTSRDRPMVAPEAAAPKVVGVDRGVPQAETVTPPASDDGTVTPATTAAAPEPAATTPPREPTLSIQTLSAQTRPEQPTVARDRVVQGINPSPSTGEAIGDQSSAISSDRTQKAKVSPASFTSSTALSSLASINLSPPEALTAVESSTDRTPAVPALRSLAATPAAAAAPLLLAQIVPDATLPAGERSRVSGNPTVQIEDGARRGGNLFHSFSQFSVPMGGSAYFNNAADVQNIFSRVTGGSISNIDGVLRANGTANLYLLNPNGIVFGPNAQLNIGGSFVATTANSFKFADGSEYSAINSQAPPMLTVNLVTGVQYGSNRPGDIDIQGNRLKPAPIGMGPDLGLRVLENQSLVFLAGNIRINDSTLFIASAEAGGRIELGAVTGPGVVELRRSPSDNLLSLQFPTNMIRGDVSFLGASKLDNLAKSGGNIAVFARNISVLGGSQLLAGIGGGLMGTQAGDITLDATGAVTISGMGLDRDGQLTGSQLYNAVSRPDKNTGKISVGNAGNILITARSLSVTDGGLINSSTFGQGNAGNIVINAPTILLNANFQGGGIFTTVEPSAYGQGGSIFVNTDTLSLTNGATLNVSTTGKGNAGNIVVATRSLSVTGGAKISAGTSTEFNAGTVEINARDAVQVDGFGVDPNGKAIRVDELGNTVTEGGNPFISQIISGTSNNGQGGDIRITTGSLFVTNEGELTASTFNQGDGGNITITANSLTMLNATISTEVQTGATGSAGNIAIKVRDNVLLQNRSTISSEGNQGEIVIGGQVTEDEVTNTNARSITPVPVGSITLDQSKITTSSVDPTNNPLIQAGTIALNARDSVLMRNNSEVSSTGNQGTIVIGGGVNFGSSNGSTFSIIPAPVGSITLDQSTISTSSVDPTNNPLIQAGTIALNARDSVLMRRSTVSSTGNQGTIVIGGGVNEVNDNFSFTPVPVGSITLLNGSTISTNNLKQSGIAGDITVNATDRIVLDKSKITADTSSVDESAGNIKIDPNILLLRHGSVISTSAGNGTASSGGNIDLRAGFLVGALSEKSYILANAFGGSGGKITIKTNGVFGLLNGSAGSFSLSPPFSEINANSEFGPKGVVTIETLNIDPSQGLGELNLVPIDSSSLIAQSCATGKRVALNENSFVATGRSGLPASPEDVFRNPSILTELGTPTTTETLASSPSSPATTRISPRGIVEAQGLIIDTNGKAHLVAQAPNATPVPLQQRRIACPEDAIPSR